MIIDTSAFYEDGFRFAFTLVFIVSIATKVKIVTRVTKFTCNSLRNQLNWILNLEPRKTFAYLFRTCPLQKLNKLFLSKCRTLFNSIFFRKNKLTPHLNQKSHFRMLHYMRNQTRFKSRSSIFITGLITGR